MAIKRRKSGHPKCPNCQMGMIVVSGFGKDSERKTYECLQCGYIGKASEPAEQPHAAE